MALSKQAIRAIAIRRSIARRAQNGNAANAANDNARCAYVDTTMTPGMLKACVEAAGLVQ